MKCRRCQIDYLKNHIKDSEGLIKHFLLNPITKRIRNQKVFIPQQDLLSLRRCKITTKEARGKMREAFNPHNSNYS